MLSTFGAASGKAGGVVASRGRNSAQLRVRHQARQPRSASQQNARAATGSLAGVWRQLSPGQQAAWTSLALACTRCDALGQALALSGYALFVSCNRQLQTIGVTAPLRAAPAPPAFPALQLFTASAVYNTPNLPRNLTGILLELAPTPPAPFVSVLRASAARSLAQSNVRPSNLRVLATFSGAPPSAPEILAAWSTLYGSAPPIGTITFTVNLVDPLSGFAAPALRAACTYQQTPPVPIPPGTLLIEINGVPVAEIPDTEVFINGVAIAGG